MHLPRKVLRDVGEFKDLVIKQAPSEGLSQPHSKGITQADQTHSVGRDGDPPKQHQGKIKMSFSEQLVLDCLRLPTRHLFY